MTNENPSDILTDAVKIIELYFNKIKNIVALTKLEIKLARQSIFALAILMACLAALTTSLWLTLNIIIYLLLTSMHFTALTALMIMTFINTSMLILTFSLILFIKNNLFFKSTASQIALMKNAPKQKKQY